MSIEKLMKSTENNYHKKEKIMAFPTHPTEFKTDELVISPTGYKMIVVDPSFGKELVKEIWMPRVRLAFVKKDNTINKLKNHRIFSQDRLKRISTEN